MSTIFVKGRSGNAVLVSAGCGVAASLVVNLIFWVLHLSGNGNMVSEGGVFTVFTFCGIVLFIPILEELIFRGALYHGIGYLFRHEEKGEQIAIFLTGFFFGILHIGIAGKAAAFLFSWLQCYLTKRFGLWAALLSHISFNGTTYVLLML